MSEYRKIKDLREDHDYSQMYVSNYLKVNRSTYANWENGDNCAPLMIIDKLSVLYNVPMSYLLGICKKRKYKEIKPMNYGKLLINLNALKRKKNMTYREISSKLGVSRATCYKYYSGKYIIPTNILILLSKINNVDIDELCSKI